MPSSPQTIGALLAQATSREQLDGGDRNIIYDIPFAGFEDYLLRVNKKQPDTLKKLRQLETSSALTGSDILQHLTVPDLFFSGPKVSQSLLHWGDNAQDRPAIEIIPRHQGISLEQHVTSDTRPPNSTESLAAHQDAKKHDIMRALIADPEPLRSLYQQIAFIGHQPLSKFGDDLYEDHILINQHADGTWQLSVIDIVGQEHLRRTNAANNSEIKKNAYSYVQNGHDLIQSILQPSTVRWGAPMTDPIFASFLGLQAQLKHEIDWSIMEGMPDLHAKWGGFQRLQKTQASGLPDILHFTPATARTEAEGQPTETHSHGAIRAGLTQAVALSDPPETLKLALDRLYNEAVHERSA